MEQLLIVEDDIGLNQGLCKALKADARQIISCQDLKTAMEQLLSVLCISLDSNRYHLQQSVIAPYISLPRYSNATIVSFGWFLIFTAQKIISAA